MKRLQLGELEELLLLVVANLEEGAYGIVIQEYLKEKCHRKVTISTVHSTIHRLEDKGLVESQYSHEGTSKRGGRPRLMFSVTNLGMKTISDIRELRNNLWSTIPEFNH